MKKAIIFILGFFITIGAFAQNDNKFGIHWKGFVKTDYFFDTRQNVTIREGHFLLYPEDIKLDKNGEDINDAPSLNMLSIQTRLTGHISGPDVCGAKTSVMIEGAFFGHSDGDINGFRLRHAFMKLDWQKTEMLFGQFWHPMFITECFPEVISFNTGVPFVVFSRNPQFRVSYKFCDFKLSAAAQSQRDFASPDNLVISKSSSTPLRYSAQPDLQINLQYKKGKFLSGAGVGYKSLYPRLMTDSLYKETEDAEVEGFSAMAYVKYDAQQFTVKLQGILGQNMFDGTMLGGYAVKNPTDATSLAALKKYDYREYTTLNNLSIWTEIMTKGTKFQGGLFAAYTKNLGAYENIYDWQSLKYYSTRGRNIAYVGRIAPRIVYSSGKTKFATEFEYTTAAYGNTLNSRGEVQDKSDEYPDAHIHTVSNLRLLFSAIYNF